jgi:hypothetical protein
LLGVYIVGYLFTEYFFGSDDLATIFFGGIPPRPKPPVTPEEEFQLYARYCWGKKTSNMTLEEYVLYFRALTAMKLQGAAYNATLDPESPDYTRKLIPDFEGYHEDNMDAFKEFFNESLDDGYLYKMEPLDSAIMNYESRYAVDVMMEEMVEEMCSSLVTFDKVSGDAISLVPEILIPGVFGLGFIGLVAAGLSSAEAAQVLNMKKIVKIYSIGWSIG